MDETRVQDAATPPEPVAANSVSRRGFIKGVIASGATAYGASYLFRQSGAVGAQPAAGAAERLLTLKVNGQARRVDVLPNEQLAMTLRYKLGLTGTKLGCDRAECGACTVLLDGEPHYACSILTHQVRGREVTTIEGLEGPDGKLSPVQQAVWDGAGFQCAFCAPGFIMAMTGTLRANPDLTREEMRHALSGNLCRCADYNKILDCAMHAAENMKKV
jgi:aerobic-type carbon monoxide dehydrogenase small subunit (CoxS/CutS family)